MALLVAVTLALLGFAHAGMVNNMMPNNNNNNMMMPVGNNGCGQDQNGMPVGCEIPMQNMDNMEEYLQQQMEAQQYETQQMQEKIKAQFDQMVAEVTMKKHRYVMSIVGEFVAACYCAESSAAVGASYLDAAKTLNITDGLDTWDDTRLPYQAASEEEARALIFSGLVRSMCTSAKSFNTFADQVTARIPFYQGNGKK